MIGIDEKDSAIIEVLLQDSSLSIQKIAHKTGIPIATVHNRIKKLKKEGIIKKYTVSLDKEKLGGSITAYVLIKSMPRIDLGPLLVKLMRHAHVEEGAALAGEFDIILKVRVEKIQDLDDFVLKSLRDHVEISTTQTMIAFENFTR